MIKSELYFGRTITWEDGTEDQVTHMNWIGFLKEVVDRFYDGYTYFDAFGSWKGTREESFVLVVLHENSYDDAVKIDKIIDEYKTLYNQESVLLVKSEVIANV